MSDINETIRKRRSIRKYLGKPLSEDSIKKIIEAGRFAPSAHDAQPWRFIVITNKSEIKKISDEIKNWFKSLLKLGNFTKLFSRKLKETIEAAERRVYTEKDLFLYSAPCVIIITAKKGRFTAQDCALAAENMMLSAYSMGIGSCWIGFADIVLNRKKRFIRGLGVPKGQKIMATIVFGYPEKFPSNYTHRKEEAKIINWID